MSETEKLVCGVTACIINVNPCFSVSIDDSRPDDIDR